MLVLLIVNFVLYRYAFVVCKKNTFELSVFEGSLFVINQLVHLNLFMYLFAAECTIVVVFKIGYVCHQGRIVCINAIEIRFVLVFRPNLAYMWKVEAYYR